MKTAIISVEDTTANTLRVMQWDEENRLQSLGDDGYVSRYTYNHSGGRVIKSHGPTTVAFVNGAPQGFLWHNKDNWAMYVTWLYYYGARYYEPVLAMWYGVYNLAENYCHRNPIRLVDYCKNKDGDRNFSVSVNINVGVQQESRLH